jgi:hypothetical protein
MRLRFGDSCVEFVFAGFSLFSPVAEINGEEDV